MSAPNLLNPTPIAEAIFDTQARTNLFHMGDSRANENFIGGVSKAYGVQRCWPLPVCGRGGACTPIGNILTVEIEQVPGTADGSATYAPGVALRDGTSDKHPCYWQSSLFTSNVGDGSVRMWAAALAGRGDYRLGDWSSNKPIRGRAQWIVNAKNVPLARSLEGFRGGITSVFPAGNAGPTAITLTAGTAGTIVSAEVNCGNSAASAGIRILLIPGQNESTANANCFNMGPPLFWDTSATSGLVISSMGVSNYTLEDLIANMGGDAGLGIASRCSFANFCAYLNNNMVNGNTDHVVICVEVINLSAAQVTEFDLGQYALYKAHYNKLLDLLNAAGQTLWGRNPLIKASTGPCGLSGGTDEPTLRPTYGPLRAQGTYEACVGRPNVMFSNLTGLLTCQAVAGGLGSAVTLPERAVQTIDGLHMAGGPTLVRAASYEANANTNANAFSGNGDIAWAYPDFAALQMAYDVRYGSGSRAVKRRLGRLVRR